MLTEAKGFGAPSLSVALRGGCAFTGPWGGAAGPLGLVPPTITSCPKDTRRGPSFPAARRPLPPLSGDLIPLS